MSLLLRALGAARLYRRLMLLERFLADPIVDIALPPDVEVRQLDLGDVPAPARCDPRWTRTWCASG